MARIARVVAEGVPHHITQRGNGRQTVVDDAQDHHVYLKLLREYTREHGLQVWAWCLMNNHVHLLAVPQISESLSRALGRIHSDYARYRNARAASCGHLWQARYYSCPVEGPAVWRVMAYIERNPVRAGLVDGAEGSSGRAPAVTQPITATVSWTWLLGATTTAPLAGGKLYAWAWMKRLCRSACDRLRAPVVHSAPRISSRKSNVTPIARFARVRSGVREKLCPSRS